MILKSETRAAKEQKDVETLLLLSLLVDQNAELNRLHVDGDIHRIHVTIDCALFRIRICLYVDSINTLFYISLLVLPVIS